MIGYTRKVGLRKPGTWEWAVHNQVRTLDEALGIKVRAGSLCAAAGLVDTIRDVLEQIGRESGVDVSADANWDSVWLEEQERRKAALEAAKRRVASIPSDHRRYLEGEFQRAEQEAAAIMRHGRDDPRGQESDNGQVHGPDGWWGGS